ncbi:hypothetical protein GCM10028777_27150 [Angustibacter speluncae]
MQLTARFHRGGVLRGRDQGAASIIVAVLLAGGVLLGMAAVTVDVGLIHAERRELQNGADAAALAVAQQCAVGPTCDTSTGGLANTYADSNALDSAARVTTVCGSGPSVPGCPAASGPTLTRCSTTVPSGLQGWIEARTATETGGGQTLLPPRFARALAGNGSYAGTAVRACGRAAWGTPTSATPALPVTISLCEWNRMTANGTSFAPSPPYPPYPTSFERALYLHNTTGATNCPAGPSGSDLAGGFGWLQSSGCSATVSATGWVNDDPGVSMPTPCRSVIANIVGTGGGLVMMPIYVETNGLTGSNGKYRIDGFAAFYLTGYAMPGERQDSVASGTRYCRGSDKCLYGWFTKALVPVGSLTSGGSGATPRGASVVDLIG